MPETAKSSGEPSPPSQPLLDLTIAGLETQLKAWQAYQVEGAHFIAKRLRANLELMRALGHCTEPGMPASATGPGSRAARGLCRGMGPDRRHDLLALLCRSRGHGPSVRSAHGEALAQGTAWVAGRAKASRGGLNPLFDLKDVAAAPLGTPRGHHFVIAILACPGTQNAESETHATPNSPRSSIAPDPCLCRRQRSCLPPLPPPTPAPPSIPCSAPGEEAARSSSTRGAESVSNATPTTPAAAPNFAWPSSAKAKALTSRSGALSARAAAASPERGRSALTTPQGNASGQVSNGKISLAISGGVTGTMIVTFTSSRQSVAITTQGVALKSVSIDLTRS